MLKKIMKKVISVFLSVIFLLSMVSYVSAKQLSSKDEINEEYSLEYYENLKDEIQSVVKEVEELDADSLSLYMEENADRIDDIDKRFGEYIDYYMNKDIQNKLHSESFSESNTFNIINYEVSEEYIKEKNDLVLDMLGRGNNEEITLPNDDQIEIDNEEQFNTYSVSNVNSGYEYLGQYHDSYFEWSSYGRRNGWMTYSMVPRADVRIFKSSADTAWLVLRGSWAYSMTKNLNGLKDQFLCHYHARIEYEWNIEVERPDVGMTKTIAKFCNPE